MSDLAVSVDDHGRRPAADPVALADRTHGVGHDRKSETEFAPECRRRFGVSTVDNREWKKPVPIRQALETQEALQRALRRSRSCFGEDEDDQAPS